MNPAPQSPSTAAGATHLELINAGVHANVAAPAIARSCWKLPADAMLRDVVWAFREDEAGHRDVNHGLADAMCGDAATAAPQ